MIDGIVPDDTFRWHDGERLIVYGPGTLRDARGLAGERYELLTGSRVPDGAEALTAGAARVHQVGPGRVDELAAELRGEVRGPLLVALGGGRVIDTAKAIAAAEPPMRVMAVPSTLSGAEMTVIHRHAVGVAPDTRHVRPAIVVNDPDLSASQPLQELAASAGNALGHAAEGPASVMSNPVARMAALCSASLIAQAFAGPADPDRRALALGALLAGYTIDSTRYGLHHVLSQTLVRFAGVGHGPANTIMLPISLHALEQRSPAWIEGALRQALGEEPAGFARRLGALAGSERLRDHGVTDAVLERCAEEAAARPELHLTPPAATREELLALYREAY